MRAEKSFVTVASVVEEVAPGKFLFEKKEDLIGLAPARFEVRMVDGTAAELTSGATYVLGHSGFLANFRFPGIKHDDPEGAKVSEVPGVGLALFEDSPTVRFLVTSSDPANPAPNRHVLDAILAQLARPHVRSRRLAAVELYFRPELGGMITDRDVSALRAALREADLDADVRDYLLQSASVWPEPARGAWLVDEARAALAAQPSAQLDPGSGVPSLIATSLRLLRASVRPADAAAVARFVESNNAYVSDAALRVLEGLDPELALSSAEEALTRKTVTGETRRSLERYVSEERKTRGGRDGASGQESRGSPGAAAPAAPAFLPHDPGSPLAVPPTILFARQPRCAVAPFQRIPVVDF
jgi:hypothetical protein